MVLKSVLVYLMHNTWARSKDRKAEKCLGESCCYKTKAEAGAAAACNSFWIQRKIENCVRFK